MNTTPKAHSQSGFMSVESIGNALFYLIMIGIAALCVSVVMGTGKGAADISALSMLRSNVQYVGSSMHTYAGVNNIHLANAVPLIGGATSPFTLPSGRQVAVTGAVSAFNSTVTFSTPITNADKDLCRKYIYYAKNAKYIDFFLDNAQQTVDTIQQIETVCNGITAGQVLALTSN